MLAAGSRMVAFRGHDILQSNHATSADPEIDRVEQNDRSTAIYAGLDDQLDFRRIF